MTDMAKFQIYNQIIEDLSQKGYGYIDEVFAPMEMAQICVDFESWEKQLKPARISELKKLSPQTRSDSIRWVDASENKLQGYFKFLDELLPRLNKELFLSLKSYETHMSLYSPGAYYGRHRDQIEGRTERKISFVLYLNSDWKVSDGGELWLYKDDKDESPLECVHPQLNRMIFFRSDLFPHEVKPSSKIRRSLTGWMRDDILP